MDARLEHKLSRIRACAVAPPNDFTRRSLLHAYVACLTFDELCEAAIQSIVSEREMWPALRSRLLRLLRESEPNFYSSQLVELVDRTTELSDTDAKIRITIEALHSALFVHLPTPTKQTVLDNWIDRGTRRCAARWLKATSVVPEVFDPSVALAYWRATGDWKAAKVLAYQASPEFLGRILTELVARCAEGWIVSKAVLRAKTVDESIWMTIRQEHPATYAYLCAKTGRSLDADEAFSLVIECPSLPFNDTRGLAIWSIGQMGLIEVLDRVAAGADELQAIDIAQMTESISTD